MQDQLAGFLTESTDRTNYIFEYIEDYKGLPISLTMPVEQKSFSYNTFPPFFDGV